MDFNNLSSILDCLKKWEEVRNSPATVLEYFSSGDHFTYIRETPPVSNLHAYPGICAEDDELYMFLIDAVDDTYSSEEDLFNAITAYKVSGNLGNTEEIPEAEAKKRIKNWNKNYPKWVTDQIDYKVQTGGLFKSFNLPCSYMEIGKEYTTCFGLKVDGSSVTNFDADLITMCTGIQHLSYFDTVKPVPPFDVIPQSDFYLLSLA